MASQPPLNPNSLYPEVIDSNPDRLSPFLSNSRSNLYPPLHDRPSTTTTTTATSSSSMYPTIDMSDLLVDLFPDKDDVADPFPGNSASTLHQPPFEETLIRLPGAILHLIDKHQSVELGSGDLSIIALRQGDGVVAALARVGDAIQWPLAKDEVSVRLDDSHYFFSLRIPKGMAAEDDGELLNYGLTFASKGQEALLNELDRVLEVYSSFSVQRVAVGDGKGAGEVLDGSVARSTAPGEVLVEGSKKKEEMERESLAYWTTLAPNVEDYSSSFARAIAKGSGKLIKGILWCGDVTVDRLKWGNDFLKRRISSKSNPSEVSPEALKRIQRAKRVSKMSEKVAKGILSGVVKVSGVATSKVVNSKAGKKFFGLLPGEIVLATLDGFGKICDAVEVAGKNVMSTSSTVTTELVSHRYGEKAAEATQEGLHATGHAIGTAWAVFKIRKALNPKNAIKPTSLAKSAIKKAASDLKNKKK